MCQNGYEKIYVWKNLMDPGKDLSIVNHGHSHKALGSISPITCLKLTIGFLISHSFKATKIFRKVLTYETKTKKLKKKIKK